MADINTINELIGNQQFSEARILIEESLKENSDDLELIKLAGLTYVNLELWQEAKKHFETVVKFKQDDATSWFYLAKCYEKNGDLSSAKNAYIHVINLREEYLDAHKNLCVILMKLNKNEDAIKYAELALKYDNEDYIYDFIIGTCYMKQKEFSKALEPFKTALKKAPTNIGVLNSLGTCYMTIGDTANSISTYEKALEINPNSSMARFFACIADFLSVVG